MLTELSNHRQCLLLSILSVAVQPHLRSLTIPTRWEVSSHHHPEADQADPKAPNSQHTDYAATQDSHYTLMKMFCDSIPIITLTVHHVLDSTAMAWGNGLVRG
jgi:hypothetical protein